MAMLPWFGQRTGLLAAGLTGLAHMADPATLPPQSTGGATTKMVAKLVGILLALIGGGAMAGIALQRDEPINSLWIVTAAVCVYVLGYRFYAKWIETRVFVVDKTRATPAERLNNGRDFIPTHRWVLFGHHFA